MWMKGVELDKAEDTLWAMFRTRDVSKVLGLLAPPELIVVLEREQAVLAVRIQVYIERLRVLILLKFHFIRV